MEHYESNDEKRSGEDIAAELATLYDDVADEYVKVFFNDHTDTPWLDKFLSYTTSEASILDIGCGPGNFAAYLINKGCKATGIDISPKMVAAARKLVPSGHFELMNCSNLLYSDEIFDAVLVAYSLLHLPKSDAITSIREIHRVLVEGGILCLMLKEGVGQYDLSASLAPNRTCFVQLWSRDEVQDVLAEMGYELLHTDFRPPTSNKELQFQKMLFIARKKPF